MTYIISNQPGWWPLISYARFTSYCVVASFSVVVYDWALTFAQEFELIWRQRWSFMTVLYISARYIGILYSLSSIWSLPVPVTDVGCNILHFVWKWIPIVVNAMLGVIMMTRIHAMYGRSSKMFIFLAVLLLVSTIATGVVTVMANLSITGGEAVLSGFHICVFEMDTFEADLNFAMIIPTAIWEILAFFLAIRIVIQHLRELRQSQRRPTIGDCFTMLIQSHALYFLTFVIMACLTLGSLSSYITSLTLGVTVYNSLLDIAQGIQMCVLGPRLILSLREYNAKLVSMSDGGTHMTSIAFHAGGDTLTGDV